MFTKSDYSARLRKAQALLDENQALLVNKDENMRYFTGVDSGRLLIWKNGAKFWLNPVYLGLAKRSPLAPTEPKKDCVSDFVVKKGFKKLGLDEISLEAYKSLKPPMKRITMPSNLCDELRKIKDKKELSLLAKAGKIASNAMRAAEESNIIGLSEFELAAALEFDIRAAGSEKPPFSMGMLCLAGPNTAYPHAPPSNRVIREGDLVILDLGAVYKGYNSDMTRTLMAGNVSEEKHSLVAFMDWLKERAIDRIETGVKISEIHNYINEEIEKKGHKFAHLSGHGIGLEIHESPSIGPDEKDVFQEGMAFTIEPGIYTTKYGARSEDSIAIVNGRERILT
jgi:Xaa-Pro dipeptidase